MFKGLLLFDEINKKSRGALNRYSRSKRYRRSLRVIFSFHAAFLNTIVIRFEHGSSLIPFLLLVHFGLASKKV